MEDFKYNPEEGFLNESEFPNPTDDTGVQARTQFMRLLNQVKDFINNVLRIKKGETPVKLRINSSKQAEFSEDGENWDVVVGTGEAGKGVPEGGAAGDYLEKVSDEAYDTTWKTPDNELTDDGETLVKGKTVKQYVDSKIYPTITVTLASNDGSTVEGQVITITDVDTGEVIKELTYTEPTPVKVAVETNYRISVNDKQYYVKPKNVTGTVKFAKDIAVTMTYNKMRRYGFKRTKTESNPATRIAYLFDAEGKTPAKMTLGTSFSYGGWEDFCNEVNRPVMLKFNGEVDYELCHTDYSKKIDGVTPSNYNQTAYEGNAMAEFRVFKYVKRYEDADYEYVIFCDGKYDDDYKCDAFIRDDGQEYDTFYYGMFMGSNISSKLRSISGQGIMASQTATTEYNYAKANGTNWNIISKSRWDYLLDLATLIAKSDNLQATFGNGFCNGSAQKTPGSLYNKGQFFGYSSQTDSVKIFHVEDPWGNVWERMNGLVNISGMIAAKYHGPYPTPSDSNVYSDYTNIHNAPAEGYVKDAYGGALGFVPKTTGGSDSTYFCDYFYTNNSGVRFAVVGGDWGYGLKCGRCVYLGYASSVTYAGIGSRISY